MENKKNGKPAGLLWHGMRVFGTPIFYSMTNPLSPVTDGMRHYGTEGDDIPEKDDPAYRGAEDADTEEPDEQVTFFQAEPEEQDEQEITEREREQASPHHPEFG